MALILKILKYLIFFLFFLSFSIFIFLKTYYQFGGSPDLKSLTIIEKSKNYFVDGFANIENAPRYRIDKNNPIRKDPSLKDWFFPPEGKNPSNTF